MIFAILIPFENEMIMVSLHVIIENQYIFIGNKQGRAADKGINYTFLENNGIRIGLKLVMDMQWIFTFASVSNPTAQISILQRDPNSSNPKVTTTIEVTDIDNTYAKTVSAGYKIVYPITNEPWV
jgi:hypothetical protein